MGNALRFPDEDSVKIVMRMESLQRGAQLLNNAALNPIICFRERVLQGQSLCARGACFLFRGDFDCTEGRRSCSYSFDTSRNVNHVRSNRFRELQKT